MNHASATSLSERNMRTVKTPDSATVATAKSRARQLLGARTAIITTAARRLEAVHTSRARVVRPDLA
jgi:hypothetical protein